MKDTAGKSVPVKDEALAETLLKINEAAYNSAAFSGLPTCTPTIV